MTRYPSIAILFGLLSAAPLVGCGDHVPKTAARVGDVDRIAQIVARHDDRVSVDELARWIIQGKKDFVLIDVRPASDFAAGHIEGARNLAVPELLAPDQVKTLPKDRKVVVYSQGSEIAAQAVVLLRLAGYDADLLLGGYNFWHQHVLNPAIHPTLSDEEYPNTAEQQAIACYFVGNKSATQPPPQVVSPVAPAFAPPVLKPSAPPPNRSHEGC